MAFESDQLQNKYAVVEVKRLESDDMFRFLHEDQTQLRDAMIAPLWEILLADLPELKDSAHDMDQLEWTIFRAPEEIRTAFYFVCVDLYPHIVQSLLNDPAFASADDEGLALFLTNDAYLHNLCVRYRHSEPDVLDITSFVRAIRTMYLTTVGVVTPPLQRRHRPSS